MDETNNDTSLMLYMQFTIVDIQFIVSRDYLFVSLSLAFYFAWMSV